MTVQHVNRRGDTYYVFQGKTKTGKPRYFASKQETSDKGIRIDEMPEGFEIAENPSTAMITVRKCRPTRVLEAERELVERLATELSAYSVLQVIVDGDFVVVYTPDRDPGQVARLFGESSGVDRWTARYTNYTANVRFELVDEDERLYLAQRFCYLGSIDDWILIGEPASLETLVRKFAPHLGQESFFELM